MAKIGTHLSVAGGLHQAALSAAELGAQALQIFSGSPRGWDQEQPQTQTIRKFKKICRENKISAVFIHAKYLVNPASQNPETAEKSITSLVKDLTLSAQLQAQGVIFHPRIKNKIRGGGQENALPRLAQNLKLVLQQTPPATNLILENTAQMSLEEVGRIMKAVRSPRVKFCFDTAHAFEYGYNLRKENEARKTLQLIKEKIGSDRLVVIHTNDSKTNLRSRHDQHADIGQGEIGLEFFRLLLRHPLTRQKPLILETPAGKKEGLEGYRRNMETLFDLLNHKTD